MEAETMIFLKPQNMRSCSWTRVEKNHIIKKKKENIKISIITMVLKISSHNPHARKVPKLHKERSPYVQDSCGFYPIHSSI